MYKEKEDNERAKEYLRKAADIYRRIGAVKRIEETEKALAGY